MRSDTSDPEFTWAGTALAGVTVGTLLVIWSALWLYYLMTHATDHKIWTYLATGSLLTGLAFSVGGLSMGIVRKQTEEEADQVNKA